MQKWVAKILGALVIATSFAAGWVLLDFQAFLRNPIGDFAEPVQYDVEPGSGLIAVAHDMRRRGLIKNPRYLIWYARWRGGADRIKAGEYRLDPQITPSQLLDKLLSGDVIRHALTIPEGWTFSQLMAAVRAHEKLRHTVNSDDGREIMALLGYPDQHPEGRFFPDTYVFTAGTTDLALLQYAYNKMRQLLEAEWPGRMAGLPIDTPYQALILASIIEKETADPGEREKIAGVFIRRLQKNMRLQTDPTVIYGLGAAFDGNLRRRDLETDTPYNSYMRRGLPPTPIALPGAASLRAALHPAPGDELYFVARGDGTHHFSSTLEAHNNAVRTYQLNSGRQQ